MNLAVSQSCFAVLLLVAAAADFSARRIPNGVSVLLCVGGAAASMSHAAAPHLLSSAAAFAVVLPCAIAAWRTGLWGGGDAKFAAAVATWVGIERVPVFAAATGVAGGVLALMFFARRAGSVVSGVAPDCDAKKTVSTHALTVPYGAAIAVGAAYATLAARG